MALVPIKPANTVLLGTDYGGWSIVEGSLNETSIVYSVGIGQDATFDLALIKRVGCSVHGFDPTPFGSAEGERVSRLQPRFHFHPVGLWNEDGSADFFVPRNPEHVSFSITNLQRTQDAVRCEVRRLPTLMEELGHDYLDLLKMDIDGAEYAVLDDILGNRILVKQICVEFDQPAPVRKTLSMIRRLREHGYEPVSRRKWDFTFLRTR